MIRYLNLNQNNKKSPNENFSRELLELFTLGEGNYTEKDIKECARAFTGYSFNFEGDFNLSKGKHDTGTKTVFGKKGDFDGDDVLDIILSKKQCARHICEKIYLHFVNDVPNKRRIEEMTTVFFQNYNIEELMKYVFLSDWFYDKKNIGTKLNLLLTIWWVCIKLYLLNLEKNKSYTVYRHFWIRFYCILQMWLVGKGVKTG